MYMYISRSLSLLSLCVMHLCGIHNYFCYLQDGFWNFTASAGCELCTCGEGSTSEVCDVVTGVCPCRLGVGGDECSSCLTGYYNFTAQGCTGEFNGKLRAYYYT